MIMNDLPSKETIHDLLMNWRFWAWDTPADDTDDSVSAMFRAILPYGSLPAYNEAEAMLVEDVLRVMHKPYNPEWWILLAYYGRGMTQDEIAGKLGIRQQSVSKYRLPMARRIFSEHWAEMIRKSSAYVRL
jgi:hypothetical protein